MSYHCLEGFRLTLSKKIIKANNVIKIGGDFRAIFWNKVFKNHAWAIIIHVFFQKFATLKILIMYLLAFNAAVKLHVLSSVTEEHSCSARSEATSTGRHF